MYAYINVYKKYHLPTYSNCLKIEYASILIKITIWGGDPKFWVKVSIKGTLQSQMVALQTLQNP